MLSLQDRQEIAELAARACHATDALDAEGWAGLFTPDAVVSVSDGLCLRGREELLQHVRRKAGEGVRKRHLLNNVIIEGTPEGATLRAYVTVFRVHDGVARLDVLGAYLYHLVPQDGRWLAKQRHTMLLAKGAGGSAAA